MERYESANRMSNSMSNKGTETSIIMCIEVSTEILSPLCCSDLNSVRDLPFSIPALPFRCIMRMNKGA